ncbi:MAG: preprotein translocase subunit SecY [Lachnospiraceae bacterium]|nr:preprotein translocase subunit SecY [Lachnospiraceae bacterium]
MSTLLKALKTKDFRKKFLFTVFAVAIVRLGCLLPIPGIDSAQVSAFLQSSLGDSFSLLNSFTGGSFLSMSVFALNVTPYITASIIMQLLTIAIPALEEMQRDGEDGRKRMNKITRYVTVLLAFIESASMAYAFAKQGTLGSNYNALNIVTMIAALICGAVLVMWIGERITENGIGNGISIILLVNIISRMPNDFYTLYEQFMKGKQIGPALIAGCIIVGVVLFTTVFVIILSDAERHIPVQYSKKIQGRKQVGGQSTHIPLKVNTAGVIPIIFASSILQFPLIIQNLANYQSNGIPGKILAALSSSQWFNMEHPLRSVGLLVYIALVIIFAYFYTAITFNPIEVANNMKKQGGFIPGIRPGKPTTEYLSKLLNHIIFIGAAGLVIVAVIPYFFNGIFSANVSFGGTSLIIVVGVILETKKQIESQILVRKYSGFLNDECKTLSCMITLQLFVVL